MNKTKVHKTVNQQYKIRKKIKLVHPSKFIVTFLFALWGKPKKNMCVTGDLYLPQCSGN